MQDALLHAFPGTFDCQHQSITITDATADDMPLVYVNPGFEAFCGYGREDVIGRNCRFLQTAPDGAQENQEDIAAARSQIREAIAKGSDCIVDMPNYRRNGDRMINRLSIRPVFDPQQTLRYYIGLQSDLTAQKAIEQSIFDYIQQRLTS